MKEVKTRESYVFLIVEEEKTGGEMTKINCRFPDISGTCEIEIIGGPKK
ncbi:MULTISPECIES: hypothetical protein [Thermococcus]|uniref:Uncharacterized protein n=2 Tax=Thermococcus sibiricus TaxID=172049 RepID=C6A0N3_THESM|nr:MULTISPECIES: hypothetical protein [Thermococcus]KUK29019.1 MAG: Uncharacterized protein XD61_0473 [Thermococcus sp. 40_45]HII67681.1 hypothetical protein [Thermococcaceae archaeon]ACS89178.1 hypothetical protein TSIB_0110 [Thermococcus sibiricus MM 739]KUK17864.1 MAG: Uncharacterized protein XD54_0881 [Thermococcus sibiricus]MBC7095367.1 hypothetical protein [Thermococcus sp.]